MAIVVIGGHSRNIGKTSVVAGVIASLPEARWTAVKITQFGHGVCSANGEPCDCESAEHPVAITEERERDSGTDSSRYLAAGAIRSLWVRTRQGDLVSAMPALRREIARAENVIVESNSVLRFLRPDVYAAVLDPHVVDFKVSSLRYLDRADAILLPGEEPPADAWEAVSPVLLRGIPQFRVPPPTYRSVDFEVFITSKVTVGTQR
ncbi:MAG: hypothetical protein NVSMB62_01530 [Acidobacteriaceae bacterium]